MMPEPCGPCEGANPVVMLLTRLDNGETDRSCEADLPIMLIGQLALALETDPERLYDAIRKHLDKIDRDAAKAAAAAADPQQASEPGPAPEHSRAKPSGSCSGSEAQDSGASPESSDTEVTE